MGCSNRDRLFHRDSSSSDSWNKLKGVEKY
jgi:hypothetical protein